MAVIWRFGSIRVSASTTGSCTTRPAGTVTSQRRDSWCQRRGRTTEPAARTTVLTAARAQLRAAHDRGAATSAAVTAAGTASASTLPAGAPATATTPATTTAIGTTARTVVSVTSPVTARAMAPAPQPAHAPNVATARTGPLGPTMASPTARPPTTATASHASRAVQRVTCPQSRRRPVVEAARLAGTPEDLSTDDTAGERGGTPRDPSGAHGLE